MDVGPKFRSVKYGVPPVAAHLSKRRNTLDGGSRGIVCQWDGSEGEDGGKDTPWESINWPPVIEERADPF